MEGTSKTAAGASPAIPRIDAAPRRRRILVAEDSGEMRRLIVAALQAHGYEVTEARDGMELLDCIEAAAKHGTPDRYAAVISDVRMPWLSGLDVMAVLKAASWRTPVILITAFGDEETHLEGHDLGAAAVLDKPFEMETLTTVLRDLLASAAPDRG
jgi:DNA-binding response OmpR family regulator